MRKLKTAEGEYYHVYNRGSQKQVIFNSVSDWSRFLFYILYFQSSEVIYNISRPVSYFVRHSVFNMSKDLEAVINKRRLVEVVAFILMPNHFHLILKECEEGGISQYMQRIQNGYAKYFNTKNKINGHVFQGPYQIVHIGSNEQLLYLSAYIHQNIKNTKEWKNKVYKYPWSSFGDYVGINRFPGLLNPEIILDQVENSKEYKELVLHSGAKDLEEIEDILIKD